MTNSVQLFSTTRILILMKIEISDFDLIIFLSICQKWFCSTSKNGQMIYSFFKVFLELKYIPIMRNYQVFRVKSNGELVRKMGEITNQIYQSFKKSYTLKPILEAAKLYPIDTNALVPNLYFILLAISE